MAFTLFTSRFDRIFNFHFSKLGKNRNDTYEMNFPGIALTTTDGEIYRFHMFNEIFFEIFSEFGGKFRWIDRIFANLTTTDVFNELFLVIFLI